MSKEEQRKVPVLRFKGFTDDWEQRKLGDIATFINGRAYSKNELLHQGKYKVLRVGNFYTNDSWYYSDMELDKKYYANYGDLLYTWSATFGPHIWKGEKVIYHYHIWKIILSDEITKNFTLQLLEHDKNRLLAEKNGSTMIHLTKKDMENKEIVIPSSTNEQDKVGLLLTKLDYLIILQQRKQKLNTILRHNLLNTLISYDKVNNQCKIKTFAKVISKTINPQNFPNDKFQEYSMPAFDKNKKPDIVLGNTMHSNKFKISQPTILFNKLNVRKNRIWNITESQNNDICSTEFIPLTTKSINKNYLYFALQTDYILYHVISLSTGSSNSQKRITPNDLLNLTIPIPSQEKQEEISHILNALDKKIHGNNIKIKQLKKLKKFMLEKLFI